MSKNSKIGHDVSVWRIPSQNSHVLLSPSVPSKLLGKRRNQQPSNTRWYRIYIHQQKRNINMQQNVKCRKERYADWCLHYFSWAVNPSITPIQHIHQIYDQKKRCEWQTGATYIQHDNCTAKSKRNPRSSQQLIYSKAAPLTISTRSDPLADHLHISTREGGKKTR